MLLATGIVAEYNPFHNGHAHHLSEARQLGLPVIAVMSGSIMQRGEFAFMDKWRRALLATECGVDLVLELPAAFSLRSAQFFASGAVQLLQATGCVKYLACGAENPAQNFKQMAAAAETDKFKQVLKEQLKQSAPYAAAADAAFRIAAGAAYALRSPNDILALEYSKALLHTDIEPVFIKRVAAGYNDEAITGSIASATAIRTAYAAGSLDAVKKAVPAPTWQAISSTSCGVDNRLLWQLISYRLRMLSPDEIAACTQCSEGLENVLNQACRCENLNDAVKICSGKRYTAGRIRRLLLQLLLGRTRAYLEQAAPAYVRVLAFNDTGRALLKQMKTTCTLPVITKLGAQPQQGQNAAFAQQIELDIAASDLFSLLRGDTQICGSDFLTSPYYHNK